MSEFDPLRTSPNQVRHDDDEENDEDTDAGHLHPLLEKGYVLSGELAVLHERKLTLLMSAFHP
jgi:hypothetical protein